MKITKDLEYKLIELLKKKTISIPEIQQGIALSYHEARILTEYAAAQKWIGECDEENRFPVTAKDFSPVKLTASATRMIRESISYDGKKVIRYAADHHCLCLADLLRDVDSDSDDMTDALDELIGYGLIFRLGAWYYCRIAPQSAVLLERSDR